MKKILYLLPILLMAVSCDWFEFDNLDGYDATITGKFLDSATNEPVQFGVPDNYGFPVYEENFEPSRGTFAPSSMTWYARVNGTYTNNLVFSGDYRLETSQNNNFYPKTEQFKIAKGSNTHDFTVTPYARIKDVKFRYDAATKEIVATCKVEHGDASKTNGINVYLLIAPDRFVCKNHNNATDKTAVISGATVGEELELRISTVLTDKGENNSEFRYKQPHFLRIAAMAAHGAVKPAYDEPQYDWGAWFGAGMPADMTPFIIGMVHHDSAFTPDGTVNANATYNYANVWKVSEDFTTFEKIENEDWD